MNVNYNWEKDYNEDNNIIFQREKHTKFWSCESDMVQLNWEELLWPGLAFFFLILFPSGNYLFSSYVFACYTTWWTSAIKENPFGISDSEHVRRHHGIEISASICT